MKKRLMVSLCNCGQVFQGDRFKKHVQAAAAKGHRGHAREAVTHYCPKCNEWGDENNDFTHALCPRFTFSKAELKLIIKKLTPPSREKFLKAFNDTEAAKASEEAAAAVANVQAENPQVTEWEDIFGPPLSEDSDIELETPLKKRRLTDLDSTIASVAPKSPLKASTPTKITSPPPPPPPPSTSTTKSAHLPRTDASHINITYEHNKLKGEVSRLKKTIASLNEELGMKKGKEVLNKRLTDEVLFLKEKLAEVEASRVKERGEREKEKMRHAAKEEALKRETEELAEARSKLNEEVTLQTKRGEEAEATLKREREEWAKEKKKLIEEITSLQGEVEERNREEKKDKVLIHCEIQDNEVKRRHEETSMEDSLMCYTNESTRTRCLHIYVSGYQTHTKVRNVRWPCGKSEGAKA